MNNPQIQKLLSPEAEIKAAKLAAEAEQADQVAQKALREPLPGPTRDAFALNPEIQVGPYKVRPFYDFDFDVLSQLNHPVYRLMKSGLEGKQPELEQVPRGPDMWMLAYLMTRPAKQTRDLIRSRGVEGLRFEAEEQFSELSLAALLELFEAVTKQIQTYWGPVIKYGPEGEKSQHP